MAKKYKYRNLKHVILHGMEPYGTGIFDHPIEGGGIELIKEIGTDKEIRIDEKKSFNKKDKEVDKE